MERIGKTWGNHRKKKRRTLNQRWVLDVFGPWQGVAYWYMLCIVRILSSCSCRKAALFTKGSSAPEWRPQVIFRIFQAFPVFHPLNLWGLLRSWTPWRMADRAHAEFILRDPDWSWTSKQKEWSSRKKDYKSYIQIYTVYNSIYIYNYMYIYIYKYIVHQHWGLKKTHEMEMGTKMGQNSHCWNNFPGDTGRKLVGRWSGWSVSQSRRWIDTFCDHEPALIW